MGISLTVKPVSCGGWIFASIYARTHSTFVVSLVHTLYGTLIFTAGLGGSWNHANTYAVDALNI
ncbi:MAG: hypothetical protein IE889_00795 [Campylobacterales bacterium]|nr:hypothetical protein [Campylobacterales bacterium]